MQHPAELAGRLPGPGKVRAARDTRRGGAWCRCLWKTHLTTTPSNLRIARAAGGHALTALHQPLPAHARVHLQSDLSQVESPREARPCSCMSRAHSSWGQGRGVFSLVFPLFRAFQMRGYPAHPHLRPCFPLQSSPLSWPANGRGTAASSKGPRGQCRVRGGMWVCLFSPRPSTQAQASRYLLFQSCKVFGKGQVLAGCGVTYSREKSRF